MARSSGGGSNTLLIVGAAGVAAYYAYTQGWLSSIFGTAAAATTPMAPAVISSSAPPAASGPVSTAPTAGAGFPVYSAIPFVQTGPVPTGNKPIPAGVNVQPNSLLYAYAQQLANSGQSAAQINAAIASSLASAEAAAPGASLAGLGRVALYYPRRRVTVLLPRNYHPRTVA